MICPDCGDTSASIGEASISETNETIVKIDCPNSGCTNYDGSQEPEPYNDGYDDEEDYDEDYDSGGYDDYGNGPVRADPFERPREVRDVSHVTVKIISKQQRRNTIEICFALAGEAGPSDKCVEFFWWKFSADNKKLAQLSNNCKTFVKGLRADGQTLYKTHWKCKLDGVEPSEGGINIEANVF